MSPSDSSDDQAIREFQAGRHRERNFRRLFEAYFPTVRRFFARRIRSREDCLDLTQEVFLRAYRGLDGFRHESPFAGWLFKIARTTYLEWLRQRRAQLAAERDLAVEAAETKDPLVPDRPQEEEVLAEEVSAVLRSAIDALPLQMRRCVELRVQRDLKYEEIAELLDLRLNTVKSHLFQARKKLRRELVEYFGHRSGNKET